MSSTPEPTAQLAALRGLRSAPSLDPSQRQQLRQELNEALGRCEWFTVGVMAPSRGEALTCLRSLEQALGWSPLREDGEIASDEAAGTTVFLKGNQRNGSFRIRSEAGLGAGLLITGHNPDDPAVENTWGPLPLDLFR